MGRRIAVTGAGGFVGRHVVEELVRRGYSVEAAVGRRRSPSSALVRSTSVDLLDFGQSRRWVLAARPDRMIHLAWSTVPGEYWTSPENERWLEASRILFLAAVEAGCERIIGVGSCAEYLWNGSACSETDTPLTPGTPYGRAKNATRAALRAIAEAAGVSWSWARLFFLFGPYEQQSRLVPSVLRALLRAGTAECTDGRQERDFLYVRDAASALTALLESNVIGPVNVASGQPLAVRTLVERLVAHVGVGRVNFGAVVPSSEEPAHLVADVGRLRNEVGWRPGTSLDEAIEQSIAFERQRTA